MAIFALLLSLAASFSCYPGHIGGSHLKPGIEDFISS